MDTTLLVGLGVSIAFFFFRYAVAVVRANFAWGGVALGILVMASNFLQADYRPPLLSVLLAIVGIICLGAAGVVYLNRTNALLPSTQFPQRDPDTLYQLRAPVGQVERVAIDLAGGIVTFDIIRGAMNFNADEEFEYRNYKLRVIQSEGEAGNREGPSGRWIERRIFQVVCRIISSS